MGGTNMTTTTYQQIKTWRDYLCGLKSHRQINHLHKEEIQRALIWNADIEAAGISIPKNKFLMFPVNFDMLTADIPSVSRTSFHFGEEGIIEFLRNEKQKHRHERPYLMQMSKLGELANPFEILTMMNLGAFRVLMRDFLKSEEVITAFLSPGQKMIGIQNPYIGKIIDNPDIRVKTRCFINPEKTHGQRIIFTKTSQLDVAWSQ